MTRPPLRIAVVIPTLEEATVLGGCLRALEGQEADEVVVSDAGSLDGTADLARSLGAAVVTGGRGRGAQQNLGARSTTSEVLVFLHADCRLERGAIRALRAYLSRNRRVPAGCFRMTVDARGVSYRAIDAAAHLRAGVLGIPYGDQAIFARRSAFDRLGGFPETRLMEDVLLSLHLRRLGRVALLPQRVYVSARRWQKVGIASQSLRNWSLTALAALGVPPDDLARFYPAIR